MQMWVPLPKQTPSQSISELAIWPMLSRRVKETAYLLFLPSIHHSYPDRHCHSILLHNQCASPMTETSMAYIERHHAAEGNVVGVLQGHLTRAKAVSITVHFLREATGVVEVPDVGIHTVRTGGGEGLSITTNTSVGCIRTTRAVTTLITLL